MFPPAHAEVHLHKNNPPVCQKLLVPDCYVSKCSSKSHRVHTLCMLEAVVSPPDSLATPFKKSREPVHILSWRSGEDLSRNKRHSHSVPAARRPKSAAVSVQQVPIQQPLIETFSAEPRQSLCGCVSTSSKSTPYRVSQPCFDQGGLKSTFDLGSFTCACVRDGSLVSSGSTLTSNAWIL